MGKGKTTFPLCLCFRHQSFCLRLSLQAAVSGCFSRAFVSERCNTLFQVGTEIVFLSPVLIANYVDARFALFPFKSVCLGPFHPHLWIRQQREYQTESWWKLRLPPVSSESVLIWFLILFYFFIHLMFYHLKRFSPPFPPYFTSPTSEPQLISSRKVLELARFLYKKDP